MKTFILRTPEIADRACAHIRSLVGGETVFAVTVTEADRARTLEQNDKLHRMFRSISEECWLNGRRGSVLDWKCYLLVKLGFFESYTDLATGDLRVIPMATSKMGVRQMSELIESVARYAAEVHGVEL